MTKEQVKEGNKDLNKTETSQIPTPCVGMVVYIPPSDTCKGGKAIISSIEPGGSGDGKDLFVRFEGIPRRSLNWAFLWKDQEKLKKIYGEDEWAQYSP
jgi:hypothetical protein